jgi:hypothetical protein
MVWPALVAPFIAEYVLSRPVEPCRLFECGSCGFRWFDRRFEPAEMARLYTNYRGEEYFRSRNAHEPWYTRAFNAVDGPGSRKVAGRQRALKAFVEPHMDLGSLDSVLDYGGDSGQLIPSDIGRRKWVLDPSGVDLVEGVQRVDSESGLAAGGYDLVILSHVLEHIPDPAAMLHVLHALPTPRTGALYIEVPYERYSLRWMGRGTTTWRYLDTLRRSGPLLLAMDFFSTAVRVKFKAVPPLGFPKLHEHINFFTAGALTHLLQRCGYELITVGPTFAAPGARKPDAIGCLARPGKKNDGR